ncbi:nuclear transport factor 2 family protein [Desertimonas flava]|jgi:ketosteroid isomerase-like protein|uniref:nuclear transport factor 2 family protein n=1 Tax=Desertimonas flava TaxID=2064846 RepID=UPI000E3562BC|nr:nuclear transport factor 2 family protein [Desertimonas flava]
MTAESAGSVDPASEREAVAAVVTGYLAAFATGDPDRIASFVSEDFINEHSSALGSSLVGRDNYRQRLPTFLARFIGLRYDIEDLVIEGERAVAAYRMTFTYRDDDGREWPVSLPGVFRFTTSGGRITSRVDYWDGINFQNQTTDRSES